MFFKKLISSTKGNNPKYTNYGILEVFCWSFESLTQPDISIEARAKQGLQLKCQAGEGFQMINRTLTKSHNYYLY